jgi:hypothetical protein
MVDGNSKQTQGHKKTGSNCQKVAICIVKMDTLASYLWHLLIASLSKASFDGMNN